MTTVINPAAWTDEQAIETIRQNFYQAFAALTAMGFKAEWIVAGMEVAASELREQMAVKPAPLTDTLAINGNVITIHGNALTIGGEE